MMRALTVVLAGGCMMSGGERTISALDLRAAVVGIKLGALDARSRSAVEAGQIWPGELESELYLARGAPHLWWNTKIGQNACKIFVHHGADAARADIAVTTCGGRVIGTNEIKPALPCWRLTEVGPRIVKAASYFDGRPLDVQWQIVIGLLHRGQAEQDIAIAFGAPYSHGYDEREDGKRAEKLVFLDRSGDAYGLNITLIDDKVVGWQMPAQRVLTPEAQQRHLEAVEKRLTDKIAQVEQLAIKQHEETVKMFNEVMDRQTEMMNNLTKPPTTIVINGGASAPVGGTTSSSLGASTGPVASSAPRMQVTKTGQPQDYSVDASGRKIVNGVCRCKGYPLGHPKAKEVRRDEKCEAMLGKDNDSCDPMCKAAGYSIGQFRALDQC